MLWTTKLTNSGLPQEKFGVAFHKNVKAYNKYSQTLSILKKNLKDRPGDKDTEENIEIVQEELTKLNKKLCQTVDRYVKNPEQIEKNKERMKSFAAAKKAGTSTPSPGPAPATTEPAKPTPTPPPAATATTDPAPPKPAEPKKTTTTAPTPTAPPKKKTGAGSIIGWCVLALLTGGVVGYSMRK